MNYDLILQIFGIFSVLFFLISAGFFWIWRLNVKNSKKINEHFSLISQKFEKINDDFLRIFQKCAEIEHKLKEYDVRFLENRTQIQQMEIRISAHLHGRFYKLEEKERTLSEKIIVLEQKNIGLFLTEKKRGRPVKQ